MDNAIQSKKTEWSKNKKLVKDGFADLVYLPREKEGWDATLTGYSYSVRQNVFQNADLANWAMMNGLPVSARYEELGKDAVVLWHGTSEIKAERIMKDGFRPVNKRAVYASLDPAVSHAYTRWRCNEQEGGSAMFVLVISIDEMEELFRYTQGAKEVRLYSRVYPKYIEYVCWSDRIEFLGEEKSEKTKPWAVCSFKKTEGKWIPRSKPPVRFSDEDSFTTKQEWIELSIRRLLETFGSVSAMEIFCSLYSTISPWEALSHKEIFDALSAEWIDSHCSRNKKVKVFSLV